MLFRSSTFRRLRCADNCAKFHGCCGPQMRIFLGNQLFVARFLNLRCSLCRSFNSIKEPREESANIDIENKLTFLKGKGCNCSRCVFADARKCAKFCLILRNLSLKVMSNLFSAFMQPSSSPRVTKSAPGSNYFSRSCLCKRCSSGPTFHPCFIGR